MINRFILLICDNTVYVKKFDCIAELLKEAPKGIAYPGSKKYYILDIANHQIPKGMISILAPITSLPKFKKIK